MDASHRPAPVARCLAVWSGITLAAAAVLWFLSPDLLALTGPGGATSGGLDDLLARWGALIGAACVVWLWAVGSVAVAEGLTGRFPARVAGCPLALRRLVLASCGAVVTAGLIAPAHAGQIGVDDPGERPRTHVLSGLPLPERPSAAPDRPPARPAAAPRPVEREVVVRAGDTLWSLAEATVPAARRTPATIAARVRTIYAANRDLIGADPDLIHPHQRLRVPPQPSEER